MTTANSDSLSVFKSYVDQCNSKFSILADYNTVLYLLVLDRRGDLDLSQITLAEVEQLYQEKKFCFITFPEKEALTQAKEVLNIPDHIEVEPGATKQKHDTLVNSWKWLKKANLHTSYYEGFCGVFVAIQKLFDNVEKGRKEEDFEDIRALFIDLDSGDLTTDLCKEFIKLFKPTLIVESSPGKAHIYWMVQPGAVGLDIFKAAQKALIYKFRKLGTDISAQDIPRVLRLPGFNHFKDLEHPSLTRVIYFYPNSYAGIDEIFELCGITEDTIKASKAWKGEDKPKQEATNSREIVDFYDQFVSSPIDDDAGGSFQYLGAGEGRRNDATFHYVFKYLLGYRGLGKDEALGAALVANEKNNPPLTFKELQLLVDSAWERYREQGRPKMLTPYQIQQRFSVWGEGEENIGPTPDGVPSYEDLHFEYDYNKLDFLNPISDAAIVERLVQRFKGYIGVNPSTGFYFFPNKDSAESIGLWIHDTQSHAGETAFGASMRAVLAVMSDEQIVDQYFVDEKGKFNAKLKKSFFKELFSIQKFHILFKGLSYRPEIQVDFRNFNSLPGFVPCLNGVVNLKTGEMFNGKKAQPFKFTKYCNVRFVPGAKCPNWEKFILDICCGDTDLALYLKTVCGIIVAGDTSLQSVWLLYGTGGNGKSKFLNIMTMLLGDFAGELYPDALLLRGSQGAMANGTAVMSSLAQMYGKRLVKVGEVEEESRWNESLIKSLSGQDTISAKFYHKDPFEYIPTYNVMIRANHKPQIRGADLGIWDRFRLIPFNARFRGTQGEDRNIEEKLRIELPGIFNWCMSGYQEFCKNGLIEPQAATIMKQAYEFENFPIKEFLVVNCLDIETGNWRKSPELISFDEFFDLFNKWLIKEGKERATKRLVQEKLISFGYEIDRVQANRKDGTVERKKFINIKWKSLEIRDELKGLSKGNVVDFPQKAG